ncbi:MAG: hypothetical protein JHC84_13130 [Solirubrobacteraceae bacterium]|nr:hypothetical protein [Solirubrobacteraceae bacterium]
MRQAVVILVVLGLLTGALIVQAVFGSAAAGWAVVVAVLALVGLRLLRSEGWG